MIPDPTAWRRDEWSWRAALEAASLFGYGAFVVGSVFRIGGLSDVELVAALQATTLPICAVAARAAYRDRVWWVPVAGLLVVVGAGLRAGLAIGGPMGSRDVAIVAALVSVTLVGFAASWAVVGYVAGTAWRWHQSRERIGRRELLYSCTPVVLGGGAAFASYALFWTYFVIGLGDGGL